jgi:hypothetical protein
METLAFAPRAGNGFREMDGESCAHTAGGFVTFIPVAVEIGARLGELAYSAVTTYEQLTAPKYP